MSFTAKEEKILKKFVAALIKTYKEVKKTDGKIREVNFGSIIKNANKED